MTVDDCSTSRKVNEGKESQLLRVEKENRDEPDRNPTHSTSYSTSHKSPPAPWPPNSERSPPVNLLSRSGSSTQQDLTTQVSRSQRPASTASCSRSRSRASSSCRVHLLLLRSGLLELEEGASAAAADRAAAVVVVVAGWVLDLGCFDELGEAEAVGRLLLLLLIRSKDLLLLRSQR